jgi:hypothetical protein
VITSSDRQKPRQDSSSDDDLSSSTIGAHRQDTADRRWTMATTREELYRLLDRLPESDLDRVARFRRNESEARQRFEELLATAPIDDEPLTDEDRRAIAEGERDIAAGRGIRLDDLPPSIPRH